MKEGDQTPKLKKGPLFKQQKPRTILEIHTKV
jgi:hypothetical protein